MQAKITSVCDEGALEGTPLIGSDGFSVLVESGSLKILFDTGRRGKHLLHNMMFLDIKPDDIDKAVISHIHAGHTGGIEDLLRDREKALGIYAPCSAAETKKRSGPECIRIPEDLSDRANIYEIKDWMEIADGILVSYPMDIGNGLKELFLVIRSKRGPVVIAACSHAGADKITEAVRSEFGSYPVMYIGGVHIGRKERQRAEAIASLFSERNCRELYLNHCTGQNGMTYLRTVLGLKGVNDFYVGSSVSVEL
ncbi:MAG: MBL fold metallo-hydrolase [Candidatus Methanoplasma sp.]|jgi:7,8-dihydropterin-6-yl-methyl-4-(beta-D-ribofuranosyl)aminobenzene 5'-phosphate synthase|nr:MBL fold metallo-hydrolase [Candidatus Methanoplasma sp.]